MDDEEVNLSVDPEKGEPAYVPKPFVDEEVTRLEGEQAQAEKRGGQIPPSDLGGRSPEARL